MTVGDADAHPGRFSSFARPPSLRIAKRSTWNTIGRTACLACSMITIFLSVPLLALLLVCSLPKVTPLRLASVRSSMSPLRLEQTTRVSILKGLSRVLLRWPRVLDRALAQFDLLEGKPRPKKRSPHCLFQFSHRMSVCPWKLQVTVGRMAALLQHVIGVRIVFLEYFLKSVHTISGQSSSGAVSRGQSLV